MIDTKPQEVVVAPKKNTRIVQRRPDKQWEVLDPQASRASAVTRTQAEADARAKQILLNDGGGERVTKGVDGRIRSKDTIGRPDPNPPKDREH